MTHRSVDYNVDADNMPEDRTHPCYCKKNR